MKYLFEMSRDKSRDKKLIDLCEKSIKNIGSSPPPPHEFEKILLEMERRGIEPLLKNELRNRS